MTDRAIETTYTVRGVSKVVRTEPTGNASKTAKAHMVACKTAVAELTGKAPKVVAHDWPTVARPLPTLLRPSHGFNLDDYRATDEPAPIEAPAPVVIEPSGIPGDPFDFLAGLLANVS